MSDLTGPSSALPTRIGGVSASTGLPDNFADVDSAGNLFVKNVTSGLISSSVAALYSDLIAGVYNTSLPTLTTGQQSALQLDSSSRLIVNVGSTAPPNNIIATGTLTGTGQTVNLTLQGTGSINIDVSGPGFVGTIVVIENTPSSARQLGVLNVNASTIAASITAAGNYRVVGFSTAPTITVQFSAYTSGSAVINIYGSTAPYIMMPYSGNAANNLGTSYLNDGSGNAITSTTINSKQRLDVVVASEGVDGTAAPFYATAVGGKDGSGNLQTILTDTLGNQAILVKDSSGNGISSYNSQLNTDDIINTAISSGSITVGTSGVAARVGASNLANRKMLEVSPVLNTVYYGSTSGVTVSTGLPIYPGTTRSFSLGAGVTLYLVAASSTTVNVFEGS